MGARAANQPHPAAGDAAQRSQCLARRFERRLHWHSIGTDRGRCQGSPARSRYQPRVPHTGNRPNHSYRPVGPDPDGPGGISCDHRGRPLAAMGCADSSRCGRLGGASTQRRAGLDSDWSEPVDACASSRVRERTGRAADGGAGGISSGQRHTLLYDTATAAMKDTALSVLVLGAAIALVGWLAGPFRAPSKLRGFYNDGIAGVRRNAEQHGVTTGRVGAWAYAQRRVLHVIIALGATLALILLRPLSGAAIMWTLVITVLALLVLSFVERPQVDAASE